MPSALSYNISVNQRFRQLPEIDVSNWKPGVYIVDIKAENGFEKAEKLIIE